jgi:catechol 2,3-dioxygenase-like lactoylglutathione lyase family enzyme
MNLAKPQVDFGLFTGQLEPALRFWQGQVGLPFDHVLELSDGHRQHRHDALGSVIKVNDLTASLSTEPASGYHELLLARARVTDPTALADPDGARVVLVPPGHAGIEQVGIRLRVRDLDAHRRFYGEVLGLPEAPAPHGAAFRAGETLLLLVQHDDAPADATINGLGWRYITFQVRAVDAEHARIVAGGAREAMAPTTLGRTARISMVRDPDGNWIELSQRASIVGSLDPAGA